MKKAIRFLIKFLVLPFVAGYMLIPYVKAYCSHLYRFLRYGGEMIIYDHSDRVTIADIYEELINQNYNKQNTDKA